MARVPLVFAGADYWDRTLHLIDGRVQPEGIELQWVLQYPGPLFGRMVRGEFEAGEMSASFLVMLRDQGIDTLVGLPLFTSRSFRHANGFTRADTGIESPADLKGKRVGVPDYPMTSALWFRGIMQHEYGVRAEDVREWVQVGEIPGYNQRVRMDLPPQIKLTTQPFGSNLTDLLLKGELDAITGPSRPPALMNNPNIKPLIPDHREREKEYYRRTGIFPITHMVVMRRDVYEKYRWMPQNLMEAFAKAKAIGWEALRGHQSSNMLPWMTDFVNEVTNLFGGHPYKDGFEANRATLEALTQYSYEQGLSKRKVDPEELFAPETLNLRV